MTVAVKTGNVAGMSTETQAALARITDSGIAARAAAIIAANADDEFWMAEAIKNEDAKAADQ